MNVVLWVIILILLGRFVLDLVVDVLNLRHLSERLPDAFTGWYDAARYQRSQRYLRDTTRFHILTDGVGTAMMVVFIVVGGFNLLDRIARAAGQGPIVTGLLFVGLLLVLAQLLSLPFSIYKTFVIEARYGFNRTTVRTFVLDLVKGMVLTVVIGGPILALVFLLFARAGTLAWLWCWAAVSVIQIFLLFLSPYVIMPLFNTFTPLEKGELRDALERYAERQHFALRGIYTMDGSRRSSKGNAFFTGFGKARRIVLFDTLIQKHPIREIVAVLAHEMGHYKRRHVTKAIIRGVISMGVMFFLLSRCLENPYLFEAFQMEHSSIYAGLVFFGFLYAPISMVIGVIENAISRRHEYEADAFAVETSGDPDALIDGLKRLTVENLGNLTPHPLKVVLNYSHPPILDRIKAIRQSA